MHAYQPFPPPAASTFPTLLLPTRRPHAAHTCSYFVQDGTGRYTVAWMSLNVEIRSMVALWVQTVHACASGTSALAAEVGVCACGRPLCTWMTCFLQPGACFFASILVQRAAVLVQRAGG